MPQHVWVGRSDYIRAQCQERLRKVEANDISFKNLLIGIEGYTDDDYSRLGRAIGRNTHLSSLQVYPADILLTTTNIQFFDGLRQNASINKLFFHCHGRDIGDVSYAILNVYEEKSNLTDLHIDSTNLQDVAPLSTMLRHCTNLLKITLSECSITDEQLQSIVEATRGHNLMNLHFPRNRIGNSGCEIIATLLKDNNCSLQSLSLSHNPLFNDGVKAIADSLANNTTLKELYIENTSIFTRTAKDAFVELLCNTSSIMDTYHSNHTLHTVLAPLGMKVNYLSQLNKERNKRHVAIKKILQYHPNIDMTPLFKLVIEEGEQNLKALPYVITLFENAMSMTVLPREIFNVHQIKRIKLSTIFQFARAMPILFAPYRS